MDRDRHIKRLIAAVLGLALGAMLCLAIDAKAAPVPGDFERVKYANAVQKDFEKNGYEVWTAAYGPEKTGLLIKCDYFRDGEIILNLVRDHAKEWQAFGFKEVILTSGEVTMYLDVKKAVDIIDKKESM
jgi:hypothetical protein